MNKFIFPLLYSLKRRQFVNIILRSSSIIREHWQKFWHKSTKFGAVLYMHLPNTFHPEIIVQLEKLARWKSAPGHCYKTASNMPLFFSGGYLYRKISKIKLET